jgi:hypothetical protein
MLGLCDRLRLSDLAKVSTTAMYRLAVASDHPNSAFSQGSHSPRIERY